MKQLTLLTIAALVLVLLWGATNITTAQSPLPARSPIKPPGLDDCPVACIESIIGVDHPACNAWCVETYSLDVAAEYISPRRPVVAIPECPHSGWWQVAPWMGQYELWTDGAGYCIGRRL